MRFFDIGQEATGFIAIGQFATGVIAFGQVATGVIAVGQVARGVVAIGQLAFGLVMSGGMLSFGLMSTVGMLGIGGRPTFGGVIPLVPSVGRARVAPGTTTLEAIRPGASSWIRADISLDVSGTPALYDGARSLPVKLDRQVLDGARDAARGGAGKLFAFVERFGDVAVCTRLMQLPERPFGRASFWTLAAFQVAFLVAVAGAWWVLVGNPLREILSRL